MTANVASRRVLSPVSRMSFPKLLTPVQYQGKGEHYFSLELLVNPVDLDQFRAAIPETGKSGLVDIRVLASELAQLKWPGINVKEAVASGALHWAIHNGDTHAAKKEAEGKDAEAYKGQRFIRTKTLAKYAPQLRWRDKDGTNYDLERGVPGDMDRARDLFVGGNYAYAEMTCEAKETPQGKFIVFYLNQVCYFKPGERLGTGSSLMDSEEYAGVTGGESDYDPTEGLGSKDFDDEIPF